jgi:hypothetical protein
MIVVYQTLAICAASLLMALLLIVHVVFVCLGTIGELIGNTFLSGARLFLRAADDVSNSIDKFLMGEK